MGLFGRIKRNNSCSCESDNQDITEKQEIKECCCGNANVDCCESEISNVEDSGLTIKILGAGCKSCVTLGDNVKTALNEMNLEANIVKVTDLSEIAGYGVMSTPAMVVDEKVVSYGKVLKPSEVVKLLEKVVKL